MSYDPWKNAFCSKPREEWLPTEEIDALPPQEPTGGDAETWKRYCERMDAYEARRAA